MLGALAHALRRTPERHAALHARAAQLAEARGSFLEALDHYHKASLTGDALVVAERVVAELKKRLDYPLIRRVLEEFSVADLPPKLAIRFAEALIETSEADYTRAEEILQDLRRTQQGGAQVLFSLSLLAAHRGQYTWQLELAEEGLTLAGSAEMRSRMLRSKANALSNLGRVEEAHRTALEAVRQAEVLGQKLLLGAALDVLQSTFIDMHDFAAAERTIQRALALYNDIGVVEGQLRLTNDLADMYRLQDRTEEALAWLQKAETLPGYEQNSFWPHLLETRGDLLDWEGDTPAAAAAYERSVHEALRFANAVLAQRVRYKLSDVLRRTGQGERADRLLAEAQVTWAGEGSRLSGIEPFYEALAAFHRGSLAAAEQGFHDTLRGSPPLDQQARALAYLAELTRRSGGPLDKPLQALVGSLRSLGSSAVLHLDASVLRPLYSACATRDPFAAHLPLPARGRNLQVLARAPSLLIRTLGSLQVEFNGKSVKLPLKKSGELLVWLALSGPSTRTQIIDALWEGSADYRHVEYFKVALRRLRAVLAENNGAFNPFLYEDKYYGLTRALDVRTDLAPLREALRSDDPDTLYGALGASGDFLPESSGEWVEEQRRQILDERLAAAMRLAAVAENSAPDTALWAYRRAVGLDPLFLDAHKGLINFLQRRGDAASANLARRIYTRLLREEYGAPSAESHG